MIYKHVLTYFLLNTILGLALQQDIFKISTIHAKIKSGKTCSEIIDLFLNRSYTYNRNLNAIISYNPLARLEAQKLDEYYMNNSKLIGKLHCIPTIVKDNIDVNTMHTTGGIKALRHSIPNQDATIVEKLKAQGAIIIAKTNLAELAQSRVHNIINYNF